MSEIELVAVLTQMRFMQKTYYSLPAAHPHKKKTLEKAKRLEAIIDREIQRRLAIQERIDGKQSLRDAFKKYDTENVKQLTLM